MFFILACQWISVQAFKLRSFLKDTSGASGIEYVIIASMVAVVIATFVPGIASHVKSIFTSIDTAITPAP